MSNIDELDDGTIDRPGDKRVVYEKPPQPGGPMPTDTPQIPKGLRWNERRWKAYGLFHLGWTKDQVAVDLGMSPQTLSDWRRKWRDRFGPDFDFVTTTMDTTKSLTNYARPEAKNPREVAEQAAEDLTKIGAKGREVLWQWLVEIYNDPERIANLTEREVKQVELIARNAEARSWEISRQLASDDKPVAPQKTGVSIFAGFGATNADPNDVQNVMDGLRGALSSFREDQDSHDREVIELNGSSTEGS